MLIMGLVEQNMPETSESGHMNMPHVVSQLVSSVRACVSLHFVPAEFSSPHLVARRAGRLVHKPAALIDGNTCDISAALAGLNAVVAVAAGCCARRQSDKNPGCDKRRCVQAGLRRPVDCGCCR